MVNFRGFVRTAITSVHVSDQRRSKRVKIGNHVCIVSHIGELSDCKVRLAKARSCCASSSL